jgi:hypothetical protein
MGDTVGISGCLNTRQMKRRGQTIIRLLAEEETKLISTVGPSKREQSGQLDAHYGTLRNTLLTFPRNNAWRNA